MFCDVPYCSIWSTVPVRLGPSQDAIRIVQGMMTVVAQLGVLTGDHKPVLNWSIKTASGYSQYGLNCNLRLPVGFPCRPPPGISVFGANATEGTGMALAAGPVKQCND